MMISDPEPTEVMPTTMPPTAPTRMVGSDAEIDRRPALRQRVGAAVAASSALDQPDVGADREARGSEQQGDAERDPDDLLHLLAAARAPGRSAPR